ncbi:MAG: pyruvate formate lyase family protein, partial [Lacipirellulaceae bacterium]
MVGYLTEAEELDAALNMLNDRAPFGHVTPDYQTLLRKGIRGIVRDCHQKLKTLGQARSEQKRKKQTFYQAAIIALEGVAVFAQRYAQHAMEMASEYEVQGRSGHENLKEIAQRLGKTPIGPPRSFLEAVQCLYLIHCALHTTGEITSIGRLDQLLMPFLEKDSVTESQAQEIIDCLWIKFGERALHNRAHLEDRFTFCDGALLGNKLPANYDQGSLTNQWMQQVTIGGYEATNQPKPEDGTNRLTYLCLKASRRLPLNSPTLDLRVNKSSPRKLLREASKAILSGGAHPIIMNDDRIVPALHKESGGKVSLKSARNYACDGCYETHFAGETEFSFFYIPALDLLEKTLNRVAGFATSGPMHLRGWKDSFRTIPATEFTSLEQFWEVFQTHLDLQIHRMYRNVYQFYGEKESIAPSPLLSTLIAGCLASGTDLSGGGANYKMLSPLMTGISTCADSIYALKRLVFERRQVEMSEMLACLYSNWGKTRPEVGLSLSEKRIAEIREQTMRLPRFGHGNTAVDEIAWRLIDLFCDRLFALRSDSRHQAGLARLQKRHGSDFEILISPGVGTFEQYVFSGGWVGATPDGRKSGQPIESDISPAPYYQDKELDV